MDEKPVERHPQIQRFLPGEIVVLLRGHPFIRGLRASDEFRFGECASKPALVSGRPVDQMAESLLARPWLAPQVLFGIVLIIYEDAFFDCS